METKTNLKQIVAISLLAALTLAVVSPTASAQGDGTKSSYLTNLKRLGEVFSLYAADYDGRLPLAMPRREVGAWAEGILIPTPADVVSNPPWNSPVRIGWSQTIWRNSTTPYLPYPSLILPGVEELMVPDDVFSGTPNVTSVTMNGLLHGYPTTSIASPVHVPMIWVGMGRFNMKGRIMSNPTLSCNNSPVCEFNPTGPPSSQTQSSGSHTYTPFGPKTFWVFGGNTPMVFADGSVRLVPIGTKIHPDQVSFENRLTDPFAQVNPDGSPNTFWYCNGSGGLSPMEAAYHCYFRPDRTSARPGRQDFEFRD